MTDAEDQVSLLSTHSVVASPDTINKLVMRLRAMTCKLLPVQYPLKAISDPMSRVTTPEVLDAFVRSAGDFYEALPYCLLRARQLFVSDANHNPADYDENMGRATICEVIAARMVHQVSPDRLLRVMTARYRYKEEDGDHSSASSALEAAIDQHCTLFLSTSEAQHVVNALWRGDWVPTSNDDNDIEYALYHPKYNSKTSFLGRIHPSRIGVPRYQNIFRIFVWLGFLLVYSQAVREPLDQFDPNHQFDLSEGLLYGLALSFSLEELHKMYKTLRYFTWRAFGFWTVISLTTDLIFITAFALRMIGLAITDHQRADNLHMLSFRFLSCAAPLIWMKLLTIVDGFKYIGTFQICVARMMRESAVFFAILSVLLVGFAQGMYALDASDGQSEHAYFVVDTLLEALMQAPDFSRPTAGIFGKVMYYMWMLVSTILLLNILISLFSSAYAEVVDDAEAQFLAFFAGKTVEMIRTPDSFVFPAPFNLVEVLILAPFEPFVTSTTYAKMNYFVQTVLFFVPLSLIALYETNYENRAPSFMRTWMHTIEDQDEDETKYQDPKIEDHSGLEISKVKFAELVKRFPDTSMSSEAAIMQELKKIANRLDELERKLDQQSGDT